MGGIGPAEALPVKNTVTAIPTKTGLGQYLMRPPIFHLLSISTKLGCRQGAQRIGGQVHPFVYARHGHKPMR